MKFKQKEIVVLRSMFNLHRPTIKKIANLSNLNPLVVTAIIINLEKKEIVSRKDKIIRGRGRPTIIYDFNLKFGCAIGITVLETELRFTKIDFVKNVIHDKKIALSINSKSGVKIDGIIERIISEVKNILEDNNEDPPVFCIGVSVPGMVDTENGIWIEGHQIPGINNLKLRDILDKKLGIPTAIEDDARSLALFHKKKGLGIPYKNFVLIELGWGVGAGVVFNDVIYRGRKGLAGEIGHLIVDESGSQCTCGSIGCLQTVASEKNIIRIFTERLQNGVMTTLNVMDKKKSLSLNDILIALEENDKLARSVIFEIGKLIGDACSDLIKLFSPDVLIITGSVAILSKYLKEAIDISLRQNVMQVYLSEFDIIFAGYDSKDESVGAAILSIQKYFNANSNYLSDCLFANIDSLNKIK